MDTENELLTKPTSRRRVPELSLKDYTDGASPGREQFIEAFFWGLKEYGFVVLKDHPINESLLNRAYALAESFFNLPTQTKLNYQLAGKGGARGYTPFGAEHAKDAPVADLKEFWHVGRDLPAGHRYQSISPANVWPSEIGEFKQVFQEIYRELDRVGLILLEALTHPLQLPKDYFAHMVKDGSTILRLLHYPPLPADRDPRSIRAAAHEDINLITILVSATASGLELKDRDGRWLPIESDPNSLIVDAGDMLARITNDVIPSTTHRVVNPANAKSSRYSMPFFIHPHPEAVLTCIDSCRGDQAKYPDITAQAFLEQRLREIGLLK